MFNLAWWFINNNQIKRRGMVRVEGISNFYGKALEIFLG
jgi:hypothetical protein